MNADDIDLGELGQDEFCKLCTSSGIASTPPKQDKYGWDFYLELKSNLNKNKALDMQEPNIECKVQIKSTKKINRKSLPIKLSAVYKLTNIQLPSL